VSEQSRLHEISFEGAAISDVQFRGTALEHARASEARISDVSFVQCAIDGFSLRRVKILDAEILRSRLKDVELRGTGGGWRAPGVFDTRIEDCAWTGVVFENCRFKDAVIKNVTLSGVTIADVEFTGTLDGDEAFRKAAGLGPSEGRAS